MSPVTLDLLLSSLDPSSDVDSVGSLTYWAPTAMKELYGVLCGKIREK